jgi:rfaE bifunctional protein kinase chain/domain
MPGRDLKSIFDQFKHLKVMVVGDVMVDAYIFGKVDRISPEAPVPVVSVEKRASRLGGAANVALNLKSLGAEPLLFSVIGKDAKGEEFLDLLAAENIKADGIVASSNRLTTTKFRVIGNKFQMLRVDEEVTHDLCSEDEAKLLEKIGAMLKSGNVNAVILQDYNKGILTAGLISAVIEMAGKAGIPVAVDPKKKNFLAYQDADLFKPNLKELREGLGKEIEGDEDELLKKAAAILHIEQGIKMVMVTLSDKGVFISYDGPEMKAWQQVFPAHIRNIADVSGAGDTVISVAALCLACGLGPEAIASLSNLAGGLVCEEVGVVPINREKLLREACLLLNISW